MSNFKKILLHTCCAPCSIKCIEKLKEDNIIPVVFWYNPNIHPFKEYENRKKTLLTYVQNNKIEYINHDEYGLREFISEIYPHFGRERCENCYRKRLSETVKCALEKGYKAFSTTLLISPYQNHELIKKIGYELEKKYGIGFFYRDFRPYFSEGQNEAREMNFYMQKYCGCIFSEEERYMSQIIKNREKQFAVKLLRPSTMFKNQIINYKDSFLRAGKKLIGSARLYEFENYEEWIESFDNKTLLYIAIRKSDNKLLGMAELKINSSEKFTGSIDFSVLPEEENKGYETEILKLMILKCKKYQIEKISLLCDKSSENFVNAIISNGGILKRQIPNDSKSKTVLEFIIYIN